MHKHVLLCDTNPRKYEQRSINLRLTDQKNLHVQLRETMSFYWGYLQEYGLRVPYRSRNNSKAVVSQKAYPSIGDAFKARSLCTTCAQLGRCVF